MNFQSVVRQGQKFLDVTSSQIIVHQTMKCGDAITQVMMEPNATAMTTLAQRNTF